MDARLARLARDAEHDPAARLRLDAELVRAGQRKPPRDPRRDPAPGDEVTHRKEWSRRVVACDTPVPEGYQGLGGKLWCWPRENGLPCDRVHWHRSAGTGNRAGSMSLRGWRAWASGGEVVQVAPYVYAGRGEYVPVPGLRCPWRGGQVTACRSPELDRIVVACTCLEFPWQACWQEPGATDSHGWDHWANVVRGQAKSWARALLVVA